MLTYSEIKESDLFTFFHFNEISRVVDDEENSIHIMLKPGGFIESIDIYFIITKDEVFQEGSLHLDRNWIGDEQEINVFAKDIVKSFIHELTPLNAIFSSKTPELLLFSRSNPIFSNR